jgi:mRNA interferase RelE/StbE
MDRKTADRITTWLFSNIDECENPRRLGTALVGTGEWRYRVGDYRVVVDILDDILVVECVQVGHRSKVYD